MYSIGYLMHWTLFRHTYARCTGLQNWNRISGQRASRCLRLSSSRSERELLAALMCATIGLIERIRNKHTHTLTHRHAELVSKSAGARTRCRQARVLEVNRRADRVRGMAQATLPFMSPCVCVPASLSPAVPPCASMCLLPIGFGSRSKNEPTRLILDCERAACTRTTHESLRHAPPSRAHCATGPTHTYHTLPDLTAENARIRHTHTLGSIGETRVWVVVRTTTHLGAQNFAAHFELACINSHFAA